MESNTLSIHPDSANFHFDNYQRFIHINGCTYRYSKNPPVLRNVVPPTSYFACLSPSSPFLLPPRFSHLFYPASSPFSFLSFPHPITLPYFLDSSYSIAVVNGQPQRLVKQYSVDFKEQYQQERIADMVINCECEKFTFFLCCVFPCSL